MKKELKIRFVQEDIMDEKLTETDKVIIADWWIAKLDAYQSSLLEKIKETLKGIDKDEIEDENGWWETSVGAEFGKKKLLEILDLIKEGRE